MKEADIQAKLGEKIQAIRIKRGMTQYDLSQACKIEKSSMSRIESGRANPTIRTLYRISVALEINIKALFKDIPG